MTHIYDKLPADIKKIIDLMLHQINFRETVLSINYMSHCYKCDKHIVKQSSIFTTKYKNELGNIKWNFRIPYICEYNFYT
jgi:hypothetical protein